MPPDRLCRTCRQRLDAVLWAVGRHPGCSTSPPISDDAYRRLVGHLATSLGAVETAASISRVRKTVP